MRGGRRSGFVALAVAGAVAVALIVLWTLDTRSHDGRVSRRISLAGADVGGLSRERLTAVVADLARRYPTTVIEISDGKKRLLTDAAELGIEVDEEATVATTMRAGRHGSPPARILG